MPGRVLIISPHFPPSTVAGVHRARHLAKHLPACGWQPIVLCVDGQYHTERLDPELAKLLPANLQVVRVPALSTTQMRRFGIGDIGLRGYPYLYGAVRKLVPSRPIDAVMITGSPFYPFLLASRIRKELRIPVLLDFQDPWVSSYGASRQPFTKAWAAHQLASWLEPRAVASADFITSVSERQNDELLARYPSFPRDRVDAIPIGGDASDYDYLRANPPARREVTLPDGRINFSYVGTAMPRSTSLFEALFSAVRKLVDSDEAWAERLRLNFVGTSNQPGGFGDFKLRDLAESYGLGRFVSETPQRVPYLQALDLLANSHAIFMIGSDEPHYTASKIYPGLLSGTPFLGLFHKASSAYEILCRSSGGRVLGFERTDDLPLMTDAIASSLREIALTPAVVGKVDPTVVGEYEAGNIAKRFASIFDSLVA
jgi:hypothetical protein